ncbi:MAG: DNA/RNA nuclease SfsA [Candidatus Neomarinimicrobiota bacterium]
MRIPGPLRDATFVERPNRFLTVVEIGDTQVESHLPDPGRLKELLVPGARLKVRKVFRENSSPRKTEWTTVMVKTGHQWVSIDSTLPNRFVASLLKGGDLPMFKGYRLVQTEIKQGHHRFDFLLEKDGELMYLEVKSVTLVIEGVAMFPDAVTSRGARHMMGLMDLAESGFEAGALFVCQRGDVTLFRPHWNRDPAFAAALLAAAKNGVRVWAISAHVEPPHIRFRREIPYDLIPF